VLADYCWLVGGGGEGGWLSKTNGEAREIREQMVDSKPVVERCKLRCAYVQHESRVVTAATVLGVRCRATGLTCTHLDWASRILWAASSH